MSKKLFSEFSPASTDKWEEVIQKDLKGADYTKKLVWQTDNGIAVKPYYRSEDLSNNQMTKLLPGEFPYMRGTKAENVWNICEEIFIDSVKTSNKKAIKAIQGGASSITFNARNADFKTQSDFNQLLSGINPELVSLNFLCSENALDLLRKFNRFVDANKYDRNKISGYINFDPLGHLTIKGNYYKSQKGDVKLLADLLGFVLKNFPSFRALNINCAIFHNAASTTVQEVAFALAMAVDYEAQLCSKEVSASDVFKNLSFTFATGSNYFFEIAKLRAFRYLFAKLSEAYNPGNIDQAKVDMHCVTSVWNKTIFDPYVNVLRTTTESMSAIIGGCNSVTVKPFDMCYKKSEPFSERIARNQQIVLKEESFLDKTVDPAAGSYYVENITDSLIENSWNLFLEIQKSGGYLKCLESGIIQKFVCESAENKKQQVATKKITLLGTNQYPNQGEKMGDKVKIKRGAGNLNGSRKSIIKPIEIFRAAEEFERLRISNEKNNQKNNDVLLIQFGNPTMRKARASFSSNFFSSAGMNITDTICENIDSAVREALKCKQSIVVLCSSDEEYTDFVPEFCAKVGNKKRIVLAGYPKDNIEKFRKAGLKHFIYTGCNMLNTIEYILNN